MARLQLYSLGVFIFLTVGCSRSPVVVTTPEPATLETLVGKEVAVQGKVTLRKAGLVLETSGSPIKLLYLGAQDASWPEPDTDVQVTGTLLVVEGASPETRFRLENPQSKIIENPVR